MMKEQYSLDQLDQLPEVLRELESLLESHDFTHSYSDDHRVWQKGFSQLGDITVLLDKAYESGYSVAAVDLWNKYSPDFMKLAAYEPMGKN